MLVMLDVRVNLAIGFKPTTSSLGSRSQISICLQIGRFKAFYGSVNWNRTGIRQEVDTDNSSKKVVNDASLTPEIENLLRDRFSGSTGWHYQYRRVA
jgi:hypothetical protein